MQLLNEIFLNAVSTWPQRTALACQGDSWTYQQLYLESMKCAHTIRAHVMNSNSPCVAIYGTKSLQTTAAIIGSLLAGCTYMPLDISLPADRLNVTLRTAKPDLVLTTTLNTYLEHQLRHLKFDSKIIDILELQKSIDTTHLDECITPMSPERIAYLLFTSGSTGTPKGVCISHRAILSAITMLLEHIPYNADDRIANQSAFCYDLSVFDLFIAFKVGVCVHLLPPEIMKVPKRFIEYIQEQQLTSLYMVSSAFEYILKYAPPGTKRLPLKRILLTGDPISPTLIRLMRQHLNETCNIWNLYSSVEMPYAYTQPVTLSDDTVNLKYFPLKGSQIEATCDESNVLNIKGPILFSGYKHNEFALTTIEQNPVTAYRTGDAIQFMQNGIELFGRVDRQVKILGNRIELDDIEINLESLSYIQEAVVFAKDQLLKAYVVIKQDFLSDDDIIEKIRLEACSILPAIMVPNITIIPSIPRTTSGKKDRKSLY